MSLALMKCDRLQYYAWRLRAPLFRKKICTSVSSAHYEVFMSDLTKAISIATSAHENQVDKGGKPYIEHPLRVMKQMTTDAARIVAVLHDVIEDSDYTLDDLVAAGFSEEIVQAVEALTKQKGEPYKKYLQRIKTNPIAIAVKLADLQDNMDLTRLPTITEEDIERQKKYSKAVSTLKNNE